MSYASPERLWHQRGPWAPMLRDLLIRQAELQLKRNDMAVLCAIIGHGYARTDWPIPVVPIRALCQSCGIDRNAVRLSLRRMDDLHLLTLIDRGPNKALGLDLQPLILRLAVMHEATILDLRNRRRDRTHAPAPQLPGLEDIDNPSPELVAEVLARRADARQAGGRKRPPVRRVPWANEEVG